MANHLRKPSWVANNEIWFRRHSKISTSIDITTSTYGLQPLTHTTMPKKGAAKPAKYAAEDDGLLDSDSEVDEFADYAASTRRAGAAGSDEDDDEEDDSEGELGSEDEFGEEDEEDEEEGDGVGMYEADDWDANADDSGSDSDSASEDEDAVKLVS